MRVIDRERDLGPRHICSWRSNSCGTKTADVTQPWAVRWSNRCSGKEVVVGDICRGGNGWQEQITLAGKVKVFNHMLEAQNAAPSWSSQRQQPRTSDSVCSLSYRAVVRVMYTIMPNVRDYGKHHAEIWAIMSVVPVVISDVLCRVTYGPSYQL